MPHLVEMDEKHGDEGLVVIADEVQGFPTQRIEDFAKEMKITFPITRGSTRPPTMRGIPHAVVFDPSGQLVFAGHPGNPEFDRSIKKALKEVKEEEEDAFPQPPKPLVELRTWTNADGKEIQAEVMRVEGDAVIFRMNGREIRYLIEKLSEDDQQFIADAVKEAADD